MSALLDDLDDEFHGGVRLRIAGTARAVLGECLARAPLVSKLLDANSGVSAELQHSDRFVNLVKDGVDVAIRIGELAVCASVARRLGATRRVLVA